MSNRVQFLLWILLQWAIYLLAGQGFPVEQLHPVLRWVLFIFAPILSLILIVVSLGLLNTTNLSGSQRAATAGIVHSVLAVLLIGVLNNWFGSGQFWQVLLPSLIPAGIVALGGSPLIIGIIKIRQ